MPSTTPSTRWPKTKPATAKALKVFTNVILANKFRLVGLSYYGSPTRNATDAAATV